MRSHGKESEHVRQNLARGACVRRRNSRRDPVAGALAATCRLERAVSRCWSATKGGERSAQEKTLVAIGLPGSLSRLGLEPRTYGLTYRTGFHQPESTVAVWTLPSPSVARWGATRQVSEEPLAGFLLIAQSGGFSRVCVPTALRGFQHMVRFYSRSSNRGTPIEVRCSTN